MCIHWECSQAFNNIQWLLLRSSHRRCFMNKGILKNFTGKYWASTLKILSKYMNHFMLENLSHGNIYWLSRVLFYKFLFCLNLYFYLYIYLFVKSCDFVWNFIWCHYSLHIWDKVFKNGPSKYFGRQPLKTLKRYGLIGQ